MNPRLDLVSDSLAFTSMIYKRAKCKPWASVSSNLGNNITYLKCNLLINYLFHNNVFGMLLRTYSKLPSSKVVGQNKTNRFNLRWFWVNEVQNMFVHEREKRICRRVILLLSLHLLMSLEKICVAYNVITFPSKLIWNQTHMITNWICRNVFVFEQSTKPSLLVKTISRFR